MERDSLIDKVTEELNQLARRVLSRAFEGAGKTIPLSLPKLKEISGRLAPGGWDAATLERVLRFGIEQLDESFEKISSREAAFLLFNLDGGPDFPHVVSVDLEIVDGKRYGHLFRRLAHTAGLFNANSGVRQRVAKLRRSLAIVLVDAAYSFEVQMDPHGISSVVATASPDVQVADTCAAYEDFLKLAPSLEVMDEGQSIQAVRDAFEAVDEAEAYHLALLLNFDPPLVRQASEYLLAEEMPIATACSIISADAGVFLDALARRMRQQRPTRRIEQTIAELEREHPRSIEALDFFAYTHHERISAEHVMSYLMRLPLIKQTERTHALLVYEEAVEPLIDAGLVEHHGPFARVNPLAQCIWRKLRASRKDEVRLRVSQLDFGLERPLRHAFTLAEERWSVTTIAGRWLSELALVSRLDLGSSSHVVEEKLWPLVAQEARRRFAYSACASVFFRHSYKMAEKNLQEAEDLLAAGEVKMKWSRVDSVELFDSYDAMDWAEIAEAIKDILQWLRSVIDQRRAEPASVGLLKDIYGELANRVVRNSAEASIVTGIGSIPIPALFPAGWVPRSRAKGIS
ncbi:hypothetical protein AB0M48_35095 [Lentzea sp. NPDC051208]|uniref:hypothetical protein n=1 Tax=Lentzea sp. NPDC051208 TaxID=3154642 RepID=UPI0034122ABB